MLVYQGLAGWPAGWLAGWLAGCSAPVGIESPGPPLITFKSAPDRMSPLCSLNLYSWAYLNVGRLSHAVLFVIFLVPTVVYL